MAAQARVDALYRDRDAWARKAIANVAGMGLFSSDRTIREYATEVWGVAARPERPRPAGPRPQPHAQRRRRFNACARAATATPSPCSARTATPRARTWVRAFLPGAAAVAALAGRPGRRWAR